MSARIRPSSLPMLDKCPAYTPDQAVARDDKDAGTLRHRILARVLQGDDEALLELTEEDGRDEVRWAATYIRTHAPMSAHPLECEVSVSFVGPTFEVHRGTGDVLCWADIFDLKWRQYVTNPKAQLAGYALSRFSPERPIIRGHALYACHKKAEVFTFTQAEAAALVFDIIDRALDPHPQPKVNDFCGWCAKRMTCPAVIETVTAVQASDTGTSITDPALMGEWLTRARVVKDWAEAVETVAKNMAIKQGMVPHGFDLVTKRGNRSITDLPATFGAAGLPQEEFLKACKVTFSKLVEIAAEFRGMKKAQAERDLDARLKKIITRGASVTYLRSL